MRVLGIDPGTGITGWGIVEQNQNILHAIAYGVIRTESTKPMPERLKEIYQALEEIIEKYNPETVGIENLFFFKNQKTVISVGQARGVLIVCSVNKGKKVYDYTPLQVKQAITGYGRAEKKQMQKMVKMILNLKELPKPDDAADALAVSICHINSLKTLIHNQK